VNVLAEARWPEAGDPAGPPQIPGFAESSFAPLIAAVAGRCLERRTGEPPDRTAIVLSSVLGDLATATAVVAAVDAGRRVPPLLFYQSAPNSVLGHVAAKWGLTGPVVSLSPVADPLAGGLDVAAGLIADGDADQVLVIVADPADEESARAVLMGGA
jgi:3-oxoacyl-(acyl-carrier-protein) synthase